MTSGDRHLLPIVPVDEQQLIVGSCCDPQKTDMETFEANCKELKKPFERIKCKLLKSVAVSVC